MYLFVKFINGKSFELDNVHAYGERFDNLLIVKDQNSNHTEDLPTSLDFASGLCIFCPPQIIIPKGAIFWYTQDKKFKEFMEPKPSTLLEELGLQTQET